MFPQFETAEQEKRFDDLLSSLETKDGLVQTNHLEIEHDNSLRLKKHPEILVSPLGPAARVVQLIVGEPALWAQAAFRISYGRRNYARAPVYGVPFARAIELTHQHRLMKAQFWTDMPEESGASAQLFIQLNRGKSNMVNSWDLRAGSGLGQVKK